MAQYRIVKQKRLELLWETTWQGNSKPVLNPVIYYQAQVEVILSDIEKVSRWDSITSEETNLEYVKALIEQYDYEKNNAVDIIPYVIAKNNSYTK